jgi:hypothetical protein|tara:strand:+ start:70 stop:195 length:126 start_codon:yes stop_codon:yes gene_type:complete
MATLVSVEVVVEHKMPVKMEEDPLLVLVEMEHHLQISVDQH